MFELHIRLTSLHEIFNDLLVHRIIFHVQNFDICSERAMPWLGQLVAGLLLQRAKFTLGPVCVPCGIIDG